MYFPHANLTLVCRSEGLLKHRVVGAYKGLNLKRGHQWYSVCDCVLQGLNIMQCSVEMTEGLPLLSLILQYSYDEQLCELKECNGEIPDT